MCCGMNITEFPTADLERRARISAASEGGRARHRGGIEGKVRTPDWTVDMDPRAATPGGEVVAQGTPEQIARNPKSYTGQYLKPVLARKGKGGRRAAE